MLRNLLEVCRQRLELIAVARFARKPVLVGVVAVMVSNALLPAVLAITIARAAGRVADTAELGPDTDFGPAAGPIVLVGCVMLLQRALDLALKSLRQLLMVEISAGTRRRVRRAAAAPPGVSHLESQEMLDSAALPVSNPFKFDLGAGVEGQIWLVARYVGALGAAAVTASVSLPAAVVVFVAMTAQRSVVRRHYAASLGGYIADAPSEFRAADYWLGILGPDGAKELRVYDFGDYAADRYANHTDAANRGYADVCRSAYPLHWRIAAAVSAATCVALVLVATRGVDGGLSVEQITAALGGIVAVTTALGSMGSEAYSIEAAVPILDGLRRFEAASDGDQNSSTGGHGEETSPGVPMIVFEDVHFRYPNSSHDVLCGVDLVLRSGESVAIVGENGEGKTTLLKLLAGLYQPTKGRILVDGVALDGRDMNIWRQRLAVILQDFVRFELSAFANVAMADLDHPEALELARRAASTAGCLNLIEGLEHGWETVLSREYQRGAEVSGGEWQRIALARALYAAEVGGQVLVLDEPTAALDAEAEVALFDRLMEAASGLTRIVVSHRFSTVRRADRIVVLAGGVVAEDGDHTSLHASKGLYARLYDLQAARFIGEAAADA